MRDFSFEIDPSPSGLYFSWDGSVFCGNQNYFEVHTVGFQPQFWRQLPPHRESDRFWVWLPFSLDFQSGKVSSVASALPLQGDRRGSAPCPPAPPPPPRRGARQVSKMARHRNGVLFFSPDLILVI